MAKSRSRPNSGVVRIIGGSLRSRRIRFEGGAGLRPTPDRVRETLFNWLAGAIEGGRCLDLFAGSGALGFEAASRGANHVTLVENHPRAASKLLQNRDILGLANVDIRRESAIAFLRQTSARFDIVFLDPPFDAGLVAPALDVIASRRLLREVGMVYVEQRAAPGVARDFPGYDTLRGGRAGDVYFRLLGATACEVPDTT